MYNIGVSMAPKSVAVVGAICVIVGWLLASTVAPPTARVQSLPEQRAPRESAAEAPPTEHLQLRLKEVRPAPANRRNPFAFADGERVPPAELTAGDRPIEAPAIDPPVPAGPQFVLSGIGIAGDTRTAVLASGAEVVIVKVEDSVGGYTVAEITDHTVTLIKGSERVILQFSAH